MYVLLFLRARGEGSVRWRGDGGLLAGVGFWRREIAKLQFLMLVICSRDDEYEAIP
jgi:hypothetical protein